MGDIVKKYAQSLEGKACLSQKLARGVHSNPYDDDRGFFYLHREKLPYIVQNLIADSIGEDGWVRVSDNFADFYMTILATRIASQKSLALLTSSNPYQKLSTRLSIDDYQDSLPIAQGQTEAIGRCLLTRMIIEGITIDPLTSFDDLREFKERHKQELKSFKNGLSEIAKFELPPDITMEGLEQTVQDIYESKFLWAYDNLKRSLVRSRIKYVIGGVAALSFTNISTNLSEILSSLQHPVQICIGAGAVLAYEGYKMVSEIKKNRGDDKMSYLLSIDEELGERRRRRFFDSASRRSE
jgi:hypothetical protein